jgi:Deoxyribonuclease NucA/NucB
MVESNLTLTSEWFIDRNLTRLLQKPYELKLDKSWMQPGENVLEIRGVNQGSRGLATVGITFDEENTIYGNYKHLLGLASGESQKITFGLPKIRVNGDRYPFSADHIIDTLRQPRILTIDRNGDEKRRQANLIRYKEVGGIEKADGYDRDEAPPAVFAESVNAHVRLIPGPTDNQSSGSQIGRAINTYGSKYLVLQNGWNVDFYATEPTVPTPLRVPDVPIDWEYRVI